MGRKSGNKNLQTQICELVMKKFSEGEKIPQIGRDLRMTHQAVSAVVNRGGKRTRNSGRPRKIGPRLERRLYREARLGEKVYATELTRKNCPEIPVRTVIRALQRKGLGNFGTANAPKLTKKHIAARLRFAKKYVNKPLSFWNTVLWSDESKILDTPKPRKRVWRKRGESLVCKNVNQTSRPSSVMVWGCMCAKGVGTLHLVEATMESKDYVLLLEQNLFQSKRALRLPRNAWIFMQDNAPSHTGLLTRKWLRDRGVVVLEWPANSPDLNPIEHLWAHLKRIYAGTGSTNKARQFAQVLASWRSISPEFCANLVASMPQRLAAVIAAKGGHTRY